MEMVAVSLILQSMVEGKLVGDDGKKGQQKVIKVIR